MDKKSLQLGMGVSKAQGRLGKLILFRLVQETGRDVCYRCGKRIERSADLSIDHKLPWLDTDPALFWDLDNIAFSHISCNSQSRRKNQAVWTPELRARFSLIQKQHYRDHPLSPEEKQKRIERLQTPEAKAAATRARAGCRE